MPACGSRRSRFSSQISPQGLHSRWTHFTQTAASFLRGWQGSQPIIKPLSRHRFRTHFTKRPAELQSPELDCSSTVVPTNPGSQRWRTSFFPRLPHCAGRVLKKRICHVVKRAFDPPTGVKAARSVIPIPQARERNLLLLFFTAKQSPCQSLQRHPRNEGIGQTHASDASTHDSSTTSDGARRSLASRSILAPGGLSVLRRADGAECS